MFRNVPKDKQRKKMKIVPSQDKRKEKLDTVPTKNESNEQNALVTEGISRIRDYIRPITFFDMESGHKGYMVSSIMSLPLEMQGIDNFNNYRNAELYNTLSVGGLDNLHIHNTRIHADNIFGALIDIMISNYQIFAYNAPSIGVMCSPGHEDTQKDIFDKFGYCIYNNINNCTDRLRHYIQYLSTCKIYSINDIDANTFTPNEDRLNRTIAMMTAVSKQVNEMIDYIICSFTSQYLYQYISDLTDKDIETMVNAIVNVKGRIGLEGTDVVLSDRITLRSFLDNMIRHDIKTLLINNIVPNVNHLCDNMMITSYFIYKDLADEKRQNIK